MNLCLLKPQTVYLQDVLCLVGGQDVDLDLLAVRQVDLQRNLFGWDLLGLLYGIDRLYTGYRRHNVFHDRQCSQYRPES